MFPLVHYITRDLQRRLDESLPSLSLKYASAMYKNTVNMSLIKQMKALIGKSDREGAV